MTPNFQAQMREANADPYEVALDAITRLYAAVRLPASDGPEFYLPYIGPVPAPVVSLSRYEAFANAGLVAFYDSWMRYVEGRNNGCV